MSEGVSHIDNAFGGISRPSSAPLADRETICWAGSKARKVDRELEWVCHAPCRARRIILMKDS